MFRDGRAAEALARKREDGTLIVVPGEREHAIRATVKLWEERRDAIMTQERASPGGPLHVFGLAISAPTNLDRPRDRSGNPNPPAGAWRGV